MQNGFRFGRCEDHRCQWSVLLMLTFILICYDCRSVSFDTLLFVHPSRKCPFSFRSMGTNKLTVSVYAISPGFFEVPEIMFSLHRQLFTIDFRMVFVYL